MVELLENVRGKDVFVLQSTCTPTNDTLMEVMVMVDALKRASAGGITAAIPYLGYARQDRRPRSARVAITAKVVANMLQSVGVDRLLTMDLHSDQIQGFFDIPVPPDSAAALRYQCWRQSRLAGVEPLPTRHFQRPEDATEQISARPGRARKRFRRSSQGLWPSEGSVSEEVLALAACREGIRWMATDEGVLGRSLDYNFSRDPGDGCTAMAPISSTTSTAMKRVPPRCTWSSATIASLTMLDLCIQVCRRKTLPITSSTALRFPRNPFWMRVATPSYRLFSMVKTPGNTTRNRAANSCADSMMACNAIRRLRRSPSAKPSSGIIPNTSGDCNV